MIFRVYAFDLSVFDHLLWRLLACLPGYIGSVKAAVRLKTAPAVRQEFPGWSARALNDRHSSGAICHGNLLGPACRALVG